MVYEFINDIFAGMQFILLFLWAYWLVIGFFGFGKPAPQQTHAPQTRFLVLIPAHNEEKVIGSLLKNLQKMTYPKELYDVLVIADNCSDQTVRIAQSLGAEVVEHHSKPGEPKGKPHGIKYAIDQLGNRLMDQYDALSFFDADNLVSLNYLTEMNNHLLNGERLIQCYLDTKNPNDNWVTLSYAVSYYYMNRSWQLAKSKIGLGNAIGGTGFTVETALFHQIGWTASSLTEDLEFTMQCLLAGVSATWSHEARIFDEKPSSLRVSLIQRLRWARGHWDVCFRYAVPLLKKSIIDKDFQAFDGAIYLLNPAKIILNVWVFGILMLTTFEYVMWFSPVVSEWVWVGMLLYQFVYVLIASNMDSKEPLPAAKAFLSLFLFNVTYIPLFFWSLFTKDNKTWKRTEHTRSMEIEEKTKSRPFS